MDIASFFGLCVWLVPFTYFISLSANDNALPTNSGKCLHDKHVAFFIKKIQLDPSFADAIPHQQKQGLLKTLLNTVGIKTQDSTMPTTAPSTSTAASFNTPMDTSYTPPPSNLGMASGIHYSPNRDIQNRKAL